MAETRVADIVKPDVFNPYVVERTAELSALVQSGIVVRDPAIDTLARTGGNIISLPFFTDLTGDDEVLSATGGSLTVGKIESGTDKARLFCRGRAFGVNDLAKALSGDDPMRAIADLVAQYWNRKEQALLIKILTGVFLDNVANDASDLVKDVSIADGANAAAGNFMGSDAVQDAAQLLGDAKGMLTAIAMHSVCQTRLAKQNLITTVKNSDGSLIVKKYMDLDVITDDTCPVVAGGQSGYVYTSYLFAKGAIARGEGQAPVPTETDRDTLAGNDILVNRRHFILHPRGIAWQEANVAGNSPTNAEAALAANWSRVYEKKNIRVVALKTNG